MKKLIKTYFKFLSVIAPRLAGNQAFDLFQRPLNKKIRKKELTFYIDNKVQFIPNDGEDISYYDLGKKEGHLIVMVHGWESNAASMSAIAYKLVDLGNRVILFNLPAHGHSKIKKTNIKYCASALLSVLDRFSPTQPFSIVAHSFGSAVAALALSQSKYDIDQLIFLTTPNKITKIFAEFGDFIGLTTKALTQLQYRAEKILEQPLKNIAVQDLGSKIKYKHLLLIHDRKDKIIPKANSVDVYNHWDNTELMLIEQSGHYRMLWDEGVITKIAASFSVNIVDRELSNSMMALAF